MLASYGIVKALRLSEADDQWVRRQIGGVVSPSCAGAAIRGSVAGTVQIIAVDGRKCYHISTFRTLPAVLYGRLIDWACRYTGEYIAQAFLPALWHNATLTATDTLKSLPAQERYK